MDELIQQVISYLGAALAAALVALAVQLLRKMGFSLDAERHAQLETVVRQAVLKAEEQAAAYAKAHVSKMLPADKMRLAVAHVLAKLPRVSEAEAADIVQAVLPQMGIGAAAGAQKLGEALRSRD